MQDRAIGFIDTLPAESILWTAVFSDSARSAILSDQIVDTDEDRRVAQDKIRNFYGPPAGKTALYDTLWLAFEEAERLSKANPGRYICIMVYTDGEDTTSSKSKANLEKRFSDLQKKSDNTWVFLTQLGGNEPPIKGPHILVGKPKNPLSINLNPPKLVLGSPAQGNVSTSIRMSGVSNNMEHLSGREFKLSFVPGRGLEGHLQKSSYSFIEGDVKVELLFPEGLSADQEYRGQLQIDWPDLPKHEIQCPPTIDLLFQKEAPPVIDGLRPVSGSRFAFGKSVNFLCTTLHGAEILWDFGDGESAIAAKPRHTYSAPGDYTVSITVTAPNGLRTTKELSLEVLDVAVGVKNPGLLFVGTPFFVDVKSRGDFTLFEWIVDGRKDVGGGGKGERYEGLFATPGEHTIQAVGVHPQTKIYSDKLVVNVDVSPTVIIESPARGLAFKAGQGINFTANTESQLVESVRWVVSLHDSGEELLNLIVPIKSDGRSSVVVTPDIDSDAVVDVVATAILKNGNLGPSDGDSWTIEYPEVSAEISVAGDTRFDAPVSFALDSDLAVSVTWSFGDGEVEKGKNFNPSHVYNKYGKFEVRAAVEGRGGKTGEAFAYVDIPYAPPSALPHIKVEGASVSTIKLGDTVDLIDTSTGDIVSKQWLLNGGPLVSSKRSLIFEERGVNALLLRVTGPAGADGEKPEISEGEIEFRVVEYNHGLFWTLLAAILAIFWVIFRMFTGNGPAAWKVTIGYDEQRSPSRRLKSKWSKWHKEAVFKLAIFFTDEQWRSEHARGLQTVVISDKKSKPTVEHSGVEDEDTGKVHLIPPLSTQGLTSKYTVTDYDAPELDDKTYFIWLKRDKKANLGHALILLLLFAATLSAIYFLYRKVYLGF